MLHFVLIKVAQSQVRDPYPALKVEALRAIELLAHHRECEDGTADKLAAHVPWLLNDI